MLDKILDGIERYLTAILFAVMCVVLLLQIVFRVAKNPLSWSEEIARYLFVWIIYLAASRAMATEKHLTVDILPLLLKGRAKVVLHIVSTLLSLAFFVGLLYAGSLVLPNLLVKTQFSPATHINMFFVYLAPTVGAVLMTIRTFQILVRDIKKMTSSGHDTHGKEEAV